MAKRKNLAEVMADTQALHRIRDVSAARISGAQREKIAQKQPTSAYMAYSNVMNTYASRVQALTERHVLSKLPVLGSGDPLDVAALQNGIADLRVELNKLARGMYRSTYAAGKRASDHAYREVGRMLNLKVPVGDDTKVLVNDFAQRNIQRIIRMGEDQVKQIQLAIQKHQEGESLRKKILDSLWISRNRSKQIARDEVYQFSENEIRRWALATGSDGGIYITCRDDRVRPKHRVLDGVFFRWNARPPELTEPGCRCRLVPSEALYLS